MNRLCVCSFSCQIIPKITGGVGGGAKKFMALAGQKIMACHARLAGFMPEIW